jgi:hypothetical protein
VEFYSEIVWRDAESFGDSTAGLTKEIHLPNQLRILGRHRRQNSIEAAANRSIRIIVDQHCGTFRHLQTLQRCFSYTAATVVVSECPTKYLRQPSFQGTGFLDRSGASNGL